MLRVVATLILLCLHIGPALDTSARATSLFTGNWAEIQSTFANVEELRPVPIEEQFRSASGMLGKKEVQFSSAAFSSLGIQYARMVSLCGDGFDVFNFLAVPRGGDMPMFGADIVILPGGVLAAIDFQPVSSSPSHFTNSHYSSNLDLFQKWQTSFPPGGELPPAAQRYFSPHALWTRFGADDHDKLTEVQSAMLDYCRAYCQCLSRVRDGLADHEADDRKKFIADYLEYRTLNDPAKNMLVGAFGKDWTEAILRKVLFPHHHPSSLSTD